MLSLQPPLAETLARLLTPPTESAVASAITALHDIAALSDPGEVLVRCATAFVYLTLSPLRCVKSSIFSIQEAAWFVTLSVIPDLSWQIFL